MRAVWLVCALWSVTAPIQASAQAAPQTLRCLFGFSPCRDGSQCLPFSHLCDGDTDCPDGSDEAQCESECSLSQFQCAHGRKCILRTELCDGEAQCSDRSDEEACIHPDEECVHRCDKTVCLQAASVCNGENDCPDGSDEANCETGEPPPPAAVDCPVGFRWCRDESKCVPHQLFCDGRRDCGDGSDEDECPVACTSDQFQCSSGQCLSRDARCDGQLDCSDGLDEEGCEVPGVCAGDQWRCPDSQECVERKQMCDGERDCGDGADEQNCMDAAVDVPSGSERPPPSQPRPSDGPGLVKDAESPRPVTPGSPDEAVTVAADLESQSPDPEDVKSGGVASCGARVCNGNGECVVQDGSVVCECRIGYTGERCEEQGGVLQGPLVYAAAGVGVALVVIGAIIGITQKKKSANQRRARPIVRETSMRDLGNRNECSPAQNNKDPENPQGVAARAKD